MKLKAKVTQEEFDALSDVLKEAYQKTEDGYALDAEGVEDVTGLKNALARQTEENKKVKENLRKQAELYKDIDPERAREALQKMTQLDEQQLLDKGKIEELFDKRLSPIKKDHEAQMQSLQQQVQEREAKIGTLTQKLQQTLLTGNLSKAMGEEHVAPEWVDYLHLKAPTVWKPGEDGEFLPYDGENILYGNNGKPMAMGDWIKLLATKNPKLLLPSNGSGAHGENGNRPQGAYVISREDARDTGKYEAMKAQAEKAGVPFQVSDS